MSFLDHLLLVAGQVFTLFLLMSVGFLFAKRGRLTQDTLSRMSHLLLYVVAPCVIISNLESAAYTGELIRTVLLTAAALALIYGASMLLAAFLYPKCPAGERDALRFATIYGNVSFMGLPLVMGVLGSDAVIFCTVAIAIFNLATWTHGVVLMGGRENASPRKALLNPGVIGCAIGFFLFFTGLSLPGPVSAAVAHLGNMNTPLAMIVIGGQMASADLAATFRQPRLYAASALRLLGIPLATALLLIPFGLDGTAFTTLVILSACPAAGTTGIFAQRFGRGQETAAQTITLSTLLSILTLPLVAAATGALWPLLGG